MKHWDDYRIALALHRGGTIRAAGQLLGVNHTTVSRRLADMNKSAANPMFKRLEGRYQVTREGRPFIEAAQSIEEAIFTADRQVTGLDQNLSGPLTLSMPDPLAQYILLDALGEFQAIFPNISLSVTTTLGFVNLDHREADLVVRISNEPAGHLVGRRLFPYHRSYYCSPSYLTRHKDTNTMRWIGWPEDEDSAEWVKQSHYPDVSIGLRIEDQNSRQAAAIAGYGLLFGTCFMADPEPGLVRVPGAKSMPDRDIWVLTHPDMKDTPKIKQVMAYFVAALMEKRLLIEGRVY